MDTTNINDLISQPDICRCCLSTSGECDLTAAYKTDSGNKDIYSEILVEYFGISLSYLTEYGASRMICHICLSHLRDACTFRTQVLNAESCFVEYWEKRKLLPEIKTEQVLITEDNDSPNIFVTENHTTELPAVIKTEQVLITEENDSLKIFDEENHTIGDFEEITRIMSTAIKISRQRAPVKERRQNNHGSSDSDLPVAEFVTNNRLNVVVDKVENILNEDSRECGSSNLNTSKKRLKTNTAQEVSESKRITMTCNTILKYTTACPFRHHKSWFKCFFCQQAFMELNLLRQHTQETHTNIDEELKKKKYYPRSLQIEISNLECRECNLNLTDVLSMCRHFLEIHQKVVYKECIADYKFNTSPYTCHLCSQQFHVFRTLTTHLNDHYANCVCDVCGKSFLNLKRLKVHKMTHEKGEFPCSACGKVLKTKPSLINHLVGVHSKRVLQCQVCLKPMKHYNDRIKHMSEAHNITNMFKCTICSREYNVRHYLATHMRQTHGHKNKKCSECGMAFITNHGLKKHMLKHSGEKPFSCKVCSKAYARNYTLREHMRAHHNDNSDKL